MVEKKDAGPKKRKRRKAKPKAKAGQVITQKVVVNVGKSVPKRKRTTGTQARRSVQPEIRYQPAPIPLQPNYSTQINDLTRKIKEPTEKLIDLQNQLTLYTGPRFQPPVQPPPEPRDESISNDELKEAFRRTRGRSQSRRRSLSIKADPSPDPSPTGFQPQNDFVSGAEEPKATQQPGPIITFLPETPAEKKVESGKKSRGRPAGSTKAKKQAEAPGQTRIEESLKKE
tara:strand:- start:596 stop:1279 length:684 start_codon:yes stop_codon:yes gene_type:complete